MKQHIAIVGGGWAGLSAAVELCKHNIQVTLLESSPQLGGRARSIEWKNMSLDNGQHLMIGAYQQMLSLLGDIGGKKEQIFMQLPHRMLMLDTQTGEPAFDLQLPSLPAPLHLLFGVLKTPSLTLLEKIKLLIRFNRLLNSKLISDLSVTDWLKTANLPHSYRKNLLEPVCLAAMTTHPHQASAKAFQAVLQQTFNAPAEFTDLLIPKTDLSQVLPNLARDFILKHGANIKLRSKVSRLTFTQGGVLINGDTDTYDQVILATPARITAELLMPHEKLKHVAEQIKQLKYEPVSTLYLHFKQQVSLPYPMIGLLNGLAQWVFERAISGHKHVLAVVISAQGEHLNLSQADLAQRIYSELKTTIADLPELLDYKLITDKYATFQCHPNIDQLRPNSDSAMQNLKLCGDYVYIEENNCPGLPSTLEGALRSGVKCAQLIIQN